MAYRALYLHIPFCRAKCAYCDFDSCALATCAPGAMDAYVERVRALIDAHAAEGELARVETVYIGGGTPSVLGERLPRLVRHVRTHCAPVEFTCEANPESFTPALARDLRDAGATRISLGVQSLRDDELVAIGRVHTARQALDAIALARGAGFSTSCDLMCGLPGQTLESWERTLAELIAAGPDHVSVYPLQLEDATPLARREEAGEIEVPDEDFQAACMDMAARMLARAGLARYEVASYARPGHRCRHNIAYWTGTPYLGIGRSAASMRDGEAGRLRFRQLDDAGAEFDREELTAREAAAEDLMLACRMTDGIPRALLERACARIPAQKLRAACERAVELGLARWDGDALAPTHAGWLEGNELFGIFWGLAEGR